MVLLFRNVYLKNRAQFKSIEKLFIFFVLLIILGIGSWLRLSGIISNSFAFTYDVGRDMLAVESIVANHKIPLIGQTTGIEGIFYGPWWYYLLIPPFILFSGNPSGIAFTMAVVGIVSIVVAFIFGNKIGGKFLGITLAALTSVSPIMISLSAQIWNPNIVPLFVLLTLLVLYKIFIKENKGRLKYYFLLGILLAFNIDLEIVFGILLFIGIVLSVVITLNKKIRPVEILSFVLGLLLIFLPRAIFELRHGFLMTKSFIAFLPGGNSTEDPLTFGQIVENRILTFLDQFSASLTFGNQFLAVILILFTLFATLLFYRKAPEIMRKLIVTAVTIIVVFFAGTIVFSRALWPHYLVGLPIIYIFLVSTSLYLLSKSLSNIILPGLIFVFLFIVNLNPAVLINSFTSPIFTGKASVYRNQLAVVDYVYREASGKDFKYVVYTPPVFDYTYRYLFKWYGPEKYKYFPNKEARTAFFIIEPDPGYEDRPKQWLKLRENDGKIIKSETVKGGIIVQTRTH